MTAKSDEAAAPQPVGWALRHYMLLFVIVLVTVGSCAALFVRIQAEQDARQAAQGDANYGAQVAAKSIDDNVKLLQKTDDGLAANPGVASNSPTTAPVGDATTPTSPTTLWCCLRGSQTMEGA